MSQSLKDLTTQRWVRITGRRVNLDEATWLEGPVGDTDVIGSNFFQRLAEREGLAIDTGRAEGGLLPDFGRLSGPNFRAHEVHPQVARFYEQTSAYSFDVWSEWKGGLRPFGGVLAALFSRRLQQLNVPLSPLDTSRGIASEILQVKSGEKHLYSAWVRTLKASGDTLYAGAYSTTVVDGFDGPCIRVVFPLPNGSAIVIMRPELREDGSLMLHSQGKAFGDPGFYFYVRREERTGFARYVRALHETIHVYPAEGDEIRADHHLRFWGRSFLNLHYRMQPHVSV